MKHLILLLFFLLPTWVLAAFTEFYVQTTASNLNAGSTTADAAAQTYAGGTFVRATGVFTVAAGDPASDGVAVGDFASIYTTAGATVATFIARVTARDATTITVSLTAIAGATSSVSETAAAATCKVGGAWDGPAGAVIFPFNFVTAALTNAAGDYPRVNLKNGVTYSVTSTATHSLAGPVTFQGYTTTAGDLGRATLDGGASAITVLTASGANINYVDLIFSNGTGSNGVVSHSGVENLFLRCVASSGDRTGFNSAGGTGQYVECEAFANNISNNANGGGFFLQVSMTLVRCISHDNVNSNGVGYRAATATLIRCIADTNAGAGLIFNAVTTISIINCEFYNNALDGIDLTGASAASVYIENSNFVNNGTGGTGYGINSSGSALRNGAIINCGFGAGTEANTTGNIATAAASITVIGSVTYADNVTPWTAPSTGNFSISLAAAKATGRGAFTETAASYTGTVGYPDIGAAQSSAAGGGGGQRSYSF